MTPIQEALDIITTVKQYHEKLCRTNTPHNHDMLRKLQHAVALLEPIAYEEIKNGKKM